MINIIPYESIGSIRFEMKIEEIIDLLGKPKSVEKSKHSDEVVLRYPPPTFHRIGVSNIGVHEVSLLPTHEVKIFNINIFEETDSFYKLCKLDGNPRASFGFIIFSNLGIAVTGLHDNDESQRAVTAFRKGYWDEIFTNATPI